jgi:hypothetical protein
MIVSSSIMANDRIPMEKELHKWVRNILGLLET